MDIDISSLSPTELDELVSKIAEHRAKIAPHTSENPTDDDPIYLGSIFRVGQNPKIGTILAVRHLGLGWLCFHISDADIKILIETLTAPKPDSVFPDGDGVTYH